MNLWEILDRTKKQYQKIIYKTRQKNRKMTIVSIWTIFFIIIFLAFSGWQKNNINKIDFYVETKALQDFTNEIEINKPGKIVWAQEILVTAQAVWSIKNIIFEEGESVWENDKLIELNDDIANYNLMVQRSKNTLNSARLQYQQNKNQFDQMIQWNKLTLESSQKTFNTTQSMWEQTLKSAENTIKTSWNQKNSILLQMESEKNKLDWFLTNVLHQIDTILWETNKYKTMNDSFEIYLSAKNSSYKLNGSNQLLKLYKQKDLLNWIKTNSDIDNWEIKNNIEKMNTIYQEIKALLETMQNILTNSVSSSTFPQTQIDGLISMINWLQMSQQNNFSMFTSLKQNTDSSIVKWESWFNVIWQESSEIWYQSTIISTEKQIFDAWLWIKSAELNYESAVKNQSSTLWLASTNIRSAELAYQDSLNQLEKLNIKAPISWTIGKILVDKWQQIWIWTPIISIINKDEPMAEVWITTNEYSKINSWSRVLIEYMWEIISGNIVSISSQAWTNWLYNATIKLNKKVDIIWDVANIKIYNNNDNFTLPINIVHPLENNNAYIYTLQDNKPNILNIKIWEVRWDRVEILSEIPSNTVIVTSNIWNYNPSIHNLIQK